MGGEKGNRIAIAVAKEFGDATVQGTLAFLVFGGDARADFPQFVSMLVDIRQKRRCLLDETCAIDRDMSERLYIRRQIRNTRDSDRASGAPHLVERSVDASDEVLDVDAVERSNESPVDRIHDLGRGPFSLEIDLGEAL